MAHTSHIELIVDRPGGADLVRDYLEEDTRAVAYYGGSFRTKERFGEKAGLIDERFDRAARERAVQCVITPPGADASRLEEFVERGGYFVTTGQQPALFGGPLYSVVKALTAVRLAEAAEEALGRPVLPLFWVASEDHDWEEANHTDLIGIDNELHRVSHPAPDPHVAPPLHRVPLEASVGAQLDAFVRCWPETEFSGAFADLLAGAFPTDGTIPAGYHELMQHLLGRFGLFFTDAAHPGVKRHSRELLDAELTRAEDAEHTLRETAEALQRDGYGLQVPVLEGGVNLFLEGPRGRERLYRDGEDGFRLRQSDTRLSTDEVRARAAEDPTVLSPNVLLRPVVESVIFPTLAYVAGPGEAAYFGQLGAYFQFHGLETPIVYPRWSVTPVERKIRKVLDKFGLEISALARPFHEIAGDIARDEMPDEVKAAMGQVRGAIAKGVGELQKATAAIDPTLKGPVQHVRSQAFAALDELDKKIVQAVKRESEIGLAQLEKAQLHLFPGGKPAERVQSPFYYLARFGGSFLDDLNEAFGVNLD